MKKTTLVLFLLLTEMQIFSQNTVIDSLQTALNNSDSDKEIIELLSKIGDEYSKNGNYDLLKAIEYQRIDIAQKTENRNTEIQAYLRLCYVYEKISNFDSITYYSEKALKLSEAVEPQNPSQKISVLTTLAASHDRKREFLKAKQHYDTALTLAETQGDSLKIIRGLATSLSMNKDFSTGLTYYYTVLDLEKKLGNAESQVKTLNNIGKICKMIRKYDESLQRYEEAEALCDSLDYGWGSSITRLGKADLYFEYLNDYEKGMEAAEAALQSAEIRQDSFGMQQALIILGKNALREGKFEIAEKYAFQNYALKNSSSGFYGLETYLYRQLAAVHNLKNQPREAIFFAEKAIESFANGDLELFANLKEELYKAYKKNENYKKSLDIHEQVLAIRDSLKSMTELEKLAEVEAKYQTEKKEQQITLLEKEKALQAATLQNQLFGFAGLLGLLLLGGGLFYYRNRLNQQLHLQSMRSRISSDLHDEVGSSLTRLSMIMSSAEVADVASAKNYLQKGNEILMSSISKIRDVVWAIDAKNDAVGNLIDRMEDFAFDMLKSKDIEYQLETKGFTRNEKLPPLIRQNFYLVFKEAITNIVKHSDATKVQIDFSRIGKNLYLRIADNGSDLNNKKVSGSGLSNMELRAKRIGGKVKIKKNEHGFEVDLTAPVA